MSNIFSNLSLDLDLDIDDTSSTLSAPPSSLSSVHTPSTIFASPSQSPHREQCHFEQVPRINAATLTNEEIVRRVHETCVINGIPLVVENWHKRKEWRKDIFSLDWLKENVAHMAIEARDILSSTDQAMFLGEYLDYVQKFYTHPSDRLRGLLYGKDIICPKEWSNLVNCILPEYFRYNGKNDMMAYIPTKLRAKNLMMYVGVEGTRTPAHKDMCAAFGHNLMVHAEEGASATWYLVGRGDKDKVAHFFALHGQNIDLEKYFIPESALIEANFTVYKTEQRVGDFVLVPSNSCHQVVNNGKCSVKVSWNRVIAQTAKEAIENAIPNYQHVCRPETYRVRTVIRHTVEYWSNLAWKLYRCKYRGRQLGFDHTFGVRDFQYEYEIVLDLFKRICEDEFIRHEDWNGTVEIKKAECDATFVCDFCQCDIFNRFFICTYCTARRSEDYVICMECYLNGRNCRHVMELCEKVSMRVLIDIYKEGKLGYEVYWGKKEVVTELDHNKDSICTLAYRRWSQYQNDGHAPTFPVPFPPIQYYIRPILPSVKQKKVRRKKPNRPKVSKKLTRPAIEKPPCACSRCRRMKRRCDRATPCGACVKAKTERFCDVGGSVGFKKEVKDDEMGGQSETRVESVLVEREEEGKGRLLERSVESVLVNIEEGSGERPLERRVESVLVDIEERPSERRVENVLVNVEEDYGKMELENKIENVLMNVEQMGLERRVENVLVNVEERYEGIQLESRAENVLVQMEQDEGRQVERRAENVLMNVEEGEFETREEEESIGWSESRDSFFSDDSMDFYEGSLSYEASADEISDTVET